MHLGKIVTYHRKRKKMTIDQLVASSGIPKGTLNKIISGDTKDPQLDTMKALARALGITLDDFDPENKPEKVSQEEFKLISDYRALDKRGKQVVDAIIKEELRHTKAQAPKIVDRLMLPVYVFPAAAGEPLFADNDFDHVGFPADQVPKGADFGIRLRGDSMEPTLSDGMVVFVKRTEELNQGDIGIFMIDDEAACKRYAANHQGVTLLSDNPAYGTLKVSDYQRFAIVGKVLGHK